MRRPAPRSERLRRLALGHAAVLPLTLLAAATGWAPWLPFLLVAAVLAFVATGPFAADLVFNRALDVRAVERWRLGFYTAIFHGLPVYLVYWWIYVRPRD